jgi:hypothetical protein
MRNGERFSRDIPNYPAIQTSEKLIDYCEMLYQKAGDYANRVNELYPDVNAFTMMRNYLLLTRGMLQYHRLHWKAEKQEILRAEDLERITTITRWNFIASVSIAEYTMKEIIKRRKPKGFDEITHRLLNWERTSLFNIIKTSKAVLSMEDWEYDGWNLLREIRNASVHNNVIMDIDKSYTIDGFTIVFKRGEGLVSELSLYLYLLGLLLIVYETWFERLLEHDSD